MEARSKGSLASAGQNVNLENQTLEDYEGLEIKGQMIADSYQRFMEQEKKNALLHCFFRPGGGA